MNVERRTYVVVLAPKLKKNWRKAKHTTKPTLLSVWKHPARMATG